VTRALWFARRILERAGWRGAAGLALLLAGATVCATAVPARVAELQELRQEIGALRARYLMSGGKPAGTRSPREEQLANFYGYFPPLTSLPDWLGRIYDAAEANGVQLDAGEYKLVQERDWKLARYQVTLPLKGSYGQVRGFMAQVLNEVPAAALDEVAFRREGIGATALDVRVKLTLYLRRK
jgi:hypothetical protein